jgi:hypothetical protein
MTTSNKKLLSIYFSLYDNTIYAVTDTLNCIYVNCVFVLRYRDKGLTKTSLSARLVMTMKVSISRVNGFDAVRHF